MAFELSFSIISYLSVGSLWNLAVMIGRQHASTYFFILGGGGQFTVNITGIFLSLDGHNNRS